MGITLTEAAKEYIRKKQQDEGTEGSYFYLGLKGGGCSGYMITVAFEDEIQEGDRIFEFDDIKIAINKKSYLFLLGTTIDYTKTLMGSCLDCKIPEATRKCGCGESISF